MRSWPVGHDPPPIIIKDAGSVSSQIRYPSPARPAPQTAPDHGFSQESPRKQRVCCGRVRCEDSWQKRASTVDLLWTPSAQSRFSSPPDQNPLPGAEPGAGVGQSRAAPYDARVITYVHGPFAAPAARRTREVRGDAARQVATQTASHASAPEPSKPTANPNPNQNTKTRFHETAHLLARATRAGAQWGMAWRQTSSSIQGEVPANIVPRRAIRGLNNYNIQEGTL